jgi:hypothetical protein
MLPPCPDCGLRPRYLVNGKWSTLDKIRTHRTPIVRIDVRPQHHRWCTSEENCLRHYVRTMTRANRLLLNQPLARSLRYVGPLPSVGQSRRGSP